jgi:hypothetical protein
VFSTGSRPVLFPVRVLDCCPPRRDLDDDGTGSRHVLFGEYLKGEGILTDADIERIVEIQEKSNVWFGTLAYLLDLLRFEEIERIVAAQAASGRLFGEVAIELGLMSAADVEHVLDLQQRKRVKFGEVAVALDCLTPGELSDHLQAFSRTE